jgi:hypothetical protein
MVNGGVDSQVLRQPSPSSHISERFQCDYRSRERRECIQLVYSRRLVMELSTCKVQLYKVQSYFSRLQCQLGFGHSGKTVLLSQRSTDRSQGDCLPSPSFSPPAIQRVWRVSSFAASSGFPKLALPFTHRISSSPTSSGLVAQPSSFPASIR